MPRYRKRADVSHVYVPGVGRVSAFQTIEGEYDHLVPVLLERLEDASASSPVEPPAEIPSSAQLPVIESDPAPVPAPLSEPLGQPAVVAPLQPTARQQAAVVVARKNKKQSATE